MNESNCLDFDIMISESHIFQGNNDYNNSKILPIINESNKSNQNKLILLNFG